MPEILVAAMPPIGHVGPLLQVARGLAGRGDRVTVLTSATHKAKVHAAGARLHPLPAAADFDAASLNHLLPERGGTSGIRRVDLDIASVFVAPMVHEARELSRLLAVNPVDAIIADATFFGILPLLLGEHRQRPAVLAYTTTPLLISSRDTAPGGLGLAPSATSLGRLRNRALTLFTHRVLLRRSQRAANWQLRRLGTGPLPMSILDSGLLADRYVVPTVSEFDYPRSDLPDNVRYVGAVSPAPAPDHPLPPWWRELDGNRPVIHVTQGTVDIADLGRLIEPTIEALGGQDVIVVVTTGGRSPSDLNVTIPANTYVADFIPHDVLLPKVDVLVTNGGYGAVQQALAAGVPLVVAGDTEDKPEVAARVAWSGAGINLRTGRPSARAIRAAVRTILNDRRYLHHARRLEVAFARRDGVAEIAALVDEAVAARRAVSAAPTQPNAAPVTKRT